MLIRTFDTIWLAIYISGIFSSANNVIYIIAFDYTKINVKGQDWIWWHLNQDAIALLSWNDSFPWQPRSSLWSLGPLVSSKSSHLYPIYPISIQLRARVTPQSNGDLTVIEQSRRRICDVTARDRRDWGSLITQWQRLNPALSSSHHC